MKLAKIEINVENVVEIANKTLDEFEYKGLTIREWADKIASGKYQPVKHGHWVRRPSDHFYPCHCSECGEVSESSHYNFCSSCGTKMDGGDDE